MLCLSRYQWQELMNLGTQERSKLGGEWGANHSFSDVYI